MPLGPGLTPWATDISRLRRWWVRLELENRAIRAGGADIAVAQGVSLGYEAAILSQPRRGDRAKLGAYAPTLSPTSREEGVPARPGSLVTVRLCYCPSHLTANTLSDDFRSI